MYIFAHQKTMLSRVLITALLLCPPLVQAEDLFSDTSCYQSCPVTPSGKAPIDYFNIPAFQQHANCETLKGFCRWVKMTSPLEVKPIIVSDYDGTQSSEKITVHAKESYIADRARSENSIAFGVVAPKLKSLGYNIGMQTGDLSNDAAAKYIAARDDSCETTDFKSSQVKFDYCIGARMLGMTAQQVQALHAVMFRIFPELNAYFSTTQAMLNYLVDMGYPLWIQTGGTPYPSLQKSKIQPLAFNKEFSSTRCDFIANSSDMMNKTCSIIYNAPKISLSKVSLVMNTENVCEGVSYAEAEKTEKPQLCINDGEGKVSGLHTIEKRTKNAILSFHGNSSGDLYPGLYIAHQGGVVFIHNNNPICEAINKEVPGSCFNVVDDESEATKTLLSPEDEVYAVAAQQEGLADVYSKKKQ
ncbi:MAG: hypothetical protein KBD83_05835 [Gammaproteobacteria bacterium]|nr:hypothetical protein [Gammaproteobacteria bacterium]